MNSTTTLFQDTGRKRKHTHTSIHTYLNCVSFSYSLFVDIISIFKNSCFDLINFI